MIKNKKILVTGHSRGIGKAFYNIFNVSNTVLGYSRSNNKDLTNSQTFFECLKDIEKSDIVINNAYNKDRRYLQTEIFNQFFDMHSNNPHKAIISISSMSNYVVKSINSFNQYASSKVLLEDSINRAKVVGHKCGIIVVSPNWVRTSMYENFKKVYPNNAIDDVLEPEDLAQQTITLLDLFYEKQINVYKYELKKIS